MRIPQLPSIENAIQIYYEKTMLFTRDIKAIFKCSPVTAGNLKRFAEEKIAEKNIPVWNAGAVDTEEAFKAWGLDIKDLERRLEKLRRLSLKKKEIENDN